VTAFNPVRASWRQLVAGLAALPLSLGPFVVYANLTPEGRLLRDRVHVAVVPPDLPVLSDEETAAALAHAPRYTDAVMPLVYHGIGEGDGTDGGLALSPERFGEHVATLEAAGMSFVTAAEVAAAFDGGTRLPPNAVMISFDDGRADAMLWATPLLEAAGARATMFVITDSAGSHSVYYESWPRLRALAKDGTWDLESHTAASHVTQPTAAGELPVLTSRGPGESPAEYRARVSDDLDRASDALLDHAGRTPVAFAYPFGAHGADRHNDPDIEALLARAVGARYRIAFHQDDQEHMALATPDSPPLGLRRLTVGDWTGPELLARIVAAQQRTAGP
jgi:peptidoglycan/xylan/chitin deacetylase (PgdA/CDA1 family)